MIHFRGGLGATERRKVCFKRSVKTANNSSILYHIIGEIGPKLEMQQAVGKRAAPHSGTIRTVSLVLMHLAMQRMGGTKDAGLSAVGISQNFSDHTFSHQYN
jgi:hypothetical protein